ncbi:MAG TPA: hypothetical protein VHO68_00560, partial [Bacteroidales bacterium]|nr:hypothetical protein [Bacteroidales bacterium]
STVTVLKTASGELFTGALTELSEMLVDDLPVDGDPFEINGEIYFVCEKNLNDRSKPVIGVIPLVVRNPSSVSNINHYLDCLSVAHKKVLFRKGQEESDLSNSDKMIIVPD